MAITPADTPSDPAGYASVTPHGQGTAPYDIQAPMADLSAAVEAAGRLTGAGVIYPQSERQAESAAMLESPAGFGSGGYDITGGWTDGWPGNPEPDVAGP